MFQMVFRRSNNGQLNGDLETNFRGKTEANFDFFEANLHFRNVCEKI